MGNQFLIDLIDQLSIVPNEKMVAFANLLKNYKSHVSTVSSLLYEKLDGPDRVRFIQWFLKRWADINTVNPIEVHQYMLVEKTVRAQVCEAIKLDGRTYKLIDLNPQGYDFKLAAYDWVLAIHDVLYDQYEHKDCRPEQGDVIIDAGGFIGDTAALFHRKTRGQCEIHAFEILQENVDLFIYNCEMNGIGEQVVLNKYALSNKTGDWVGVKAASKQGATSVSGTLGDDRVGTITIDDYVIANNLNKVDLIKMDLEGSEIPALLGAVNTIRHFKPKLALCIYHKWDDVVTIPSFLQSIGVEYRLGFKWVNLSTGWEAVLLATPCNE